jgi:hypothetical protein
LCDNERCFAVRGEDFIANITISSPDVHHELISENIVFILGVGINLPMEYPHDVSLLKFSRAKNFKNLSIIIFKAF